AQEAFALAADPAAFPEQLKYVSVWQAKRLLWNAWQPQGGAPALENLISVEIGGFDPLLGRSYGEIAAEARSMHRCQAFGVARVRGSVTEFLQHEKGEQAKTDLFEGINTTWERVEGGASVQKWLLKAWQSFDPAHPELIVPYLSKALLTMEGKEGYWYEVKRREMQELLLYCAGIWMEVNSSAPAVAQGDSADLTAFIIKRSNAAVTLKSIYFGYPGETNPWNAPLKSAQTMETAKRKFIVRDIPVSQPYWFAETQETGRYVVSDRRQIGLPENPPALEAQFEFVVGGYQFSWKVPVVHKYVDRSVGELYRPFVVTPRATVNFDRQAYVFGNGAARDIQLTVRAWTPGVVSLAFDAPAGWKVTNNTGKLTFTSVGEEKNVSVTLSPDARSEAGEGKLKVWVETNGSRSSYGFQSVSYEHIPTQYIFKTAQVRVLRTDLAIAGKVIGYLQGSGDEIPAGLEQMGYRVELLNEADITAVKLSKYDAVIAGIRAYNTQPRMAFLHEQLMEYVKQGGVYMVQYNTNFDLSVKEPGPYSMRLSRDRVTDENSPVKMLKPEHQVFNYPNKITDADFSGWIQERGLYFPDQWSSEYEAVLEMNDPGEKATQGALLLARSGEGWYIHSGLAWFRQIPAGTPGAYRLLANMLSLAQTPAQP
ncbi:MAG: LmbE family protein, partial [Bacteroidetes bacterium]